MLCIKYMKCILLFYTDGRDAFVLVEIMQSEAQEVSFAMEEKVM